MPDDEAILAALDTEPDAFAVLYRRHVDDLLAYLRKRDPALAADACAETFATALDDAHRFDPARGPVVDWLHLIADRLLAHAGERGVVEDRARRRLGMAALAPGDGFVDALEEELVAAARFLSTRRRVRVALPRVRRPRVALPRLRRPPLGAVAALVVVVVALVAALVLLRGGGGDDVARDAAPAPPPNAVISLPAMERLERCAEPVRAPIPARGEFGEIALLARAQQQHDRLPFPPRRLPIGTFDPRATRLASSRLTAGVHVVPSTQVAEFAGCGADDGPGVCLVAADRSFSCFTIADVNAGRAVARTRNGVLVGVAPDGVGRVTLSSGGHSAGADVQQNFFETQLDAIRGTRVELALQRADGCERTVAPELLRAVAVLRVPRQPSVVLPAAALGVVRAFAGRIDAVVDDGARFWGGGDGVEYWVVPVVPSGEEPCAPATRVCVIAVPEDRFADGSCVLDDTPEDEQWRLAPLLLGNAAIYGVVPDGVTRVRVTIGDVSAEVEARDNVVGGVLPFPYRAEADTRVELLR